MKNTLITLALLFCSAASFAQTPVRINIGDRQKITQFGISNDSLVISLENAGTHKVDLSGLAATGLEQEAASTRDLTKDDAGKIFGNDSEDDFTYTIPDQENGEFTENVAYTFWVGNTGKIFVKGESGAGVDPREISTIEKYATIIRTGENTWRWGGTTTAWVPSTGNLYTLANSANPDNEVDATTGATGESGWTVTSVSSPSAQNGTYALKWTHSGTENTEKEGIVTLSDLVIGNTYKIAMYVQKLHSATTYGYNEIYVYTDDWEVIEELFAPTDAHTPDVWTYCEIEAIPKKTNPTIKVNASSNADPGNEIMIDNITIEDVTP